jgi:rRNA maturation RNase YbeY
MQLVHFFNADKSVTLNNRNSLKAFVTALLHKEGKRELGYLSYVFCSDKYLLEINRQFLQHDFYTDIVTFDLSSDKSILKAEIYISVDRVKENAQDIGIPFNIELHRVIFHGVLHLCGFKDKTKQQKAMMRQMEDQYIESYFK